MSERRCDQCEAWCKTSLVAAGPEAPQEGDCRLHPPVPGKGFGLLACVWPRVYGDTWCLDFRCKQTPYSAVYFPGAITIEHLTLLKDDGSEIKIGDVVYYRRDSGTDPAAPPENSLSPRTL